MTSIHVALSNYKTKTQLPEIRLDLEELGDCLCDCFMFRKDLFMSRKRTSDITKYKQLYSWFAKNIYNYKVSEIGRYFGFDHTSIIYAHKTFQNELDTENIDFVSIKDKFEDYLIKKSSDKIKCIKDVKTTDTISSYLFYNHPEIANNISKQDIYDWVKVQG